MKKGGWVFISHSHQDIDLVRKIRNHLESLGLEPLMFYLKCLSDEHEIEDLIKREIDERDWFIYADSKNARSSKWVQTERDYIETLSGKKVFTIDLTDDVDKQMEFVKHIARQMKVFISCSHKDQVLQNKISEKLLEKDMLVLTDENLFLPGEGWELSAAVAIDEASRNGFVIILITENSKNSVAVEREIQRALQCGGKIIPVYVGNASLDEQLLNQIGDIQGVHIEQNPSDAEFDKIIEHILHRVNFYHSDFKNSYSYRSAKTIHLPPISRIDNLTFFDCDNLECVYIPDSVIYITPDAFEDHPDILVKCSRNSYAEGYCRRLGIKYELIDDYT